jgi:hypothetical protein
MALGYQLPGTTIEEITRPGSANLSSSFRLLAVVGQFNPKLRIQAEALVKSNSLLLGSGFTSNTLGGAIVTSVFTITNTVFLLGTSSNGIFITTDGGATYTNYTTANSTIPSNIVSNVYYDSGKLFVATPSGLGISTDFGITFTTYNLSSSPALPSSVVTDVVADGNNIFIGTTNGVVVSYDNMASVIVYTASGAAETTTIKTITDTTVSLQSKNWLLSSTTTDYYVWYNVGGGGVDPAVVGRTGIEVSLVAGSSASAVASATAAVLNGYNSGTVFSTAVTGSTITVTAVVAGDILIGKDPTAGNTGWVAPTVGVNGSNSVAEITDLTFADAATGTGATSNYYNKYFLLEETGGASKYAIWFNADGVGTAPVVSGRTSVAVAVTSGDTTTTIASSVASAIGALSNISASSALGVVTVTQDNAGDCVDISNSAISTETPSLTISVTTPGVSAVKQVFDITSQGEVVGLGGKYFYIDTPATSYYVWVNVNSSNVDPAISGKTGIPIAISSGASAPTVASAINSALNAVNSGGSFTSTVLTNVVTAVCASIGHVSPDGVDVNTGFTFATTVQGKNSGLLANNITFIRKNGVNIYAGSASGIRYSLDNGVTWANSYTTTEGLSANNVHDISFVGTTYYVASSSGIDISINSGTSWSATPVTTATLKLSTSNNYVYGATATGVYVSNDSGTTFSLKTITDGLSTNNVSTVRVNGYTVYIGNQNGIDISVNKDVVANGAAGGVKVYRIGSLANMDNFVDYTYNVSTGVITWKNNSTNLPVPASTMYIDYEYNRPSTDFNKSYTYDSYDTFTQDWQFPAPGYLGNQFVYLSLQVLNLPRIAIVPVPTTDTVSDYLNALETIEQKSIQDLVVLSTDEAVQFQASFHVQERSAPENAFYRMYWTGGPATFPLGDTITPSSLIGRKELVKNRRTVFVNAPRGNVRYTDVSGASVVSQVDGAFIGGLICAYYNAIPSGNPNVEILQKSLPGFTLFTSDFDNYYSKKRLQAAGQASLYLLEPTGSIGIPRVIDDLASDSTTLERQNPNITRTMDYINMDVAFQIQSVFAGKLLIDPGSHVSNIAAFLNLLFKQYRSNKIIVSFKDISASRSSERADTILINYAWQGIYSHKYTKGTFYLDIPTAA